MTSAVNEAFIEKFDGGRNDIFHVLRCNFVKEYFSGRRNQ